MARDTSGDRPRPDQAGTPVPPADPGTYLECDVPPGMTLGEWAARDFGDEQPGLGASLRGGVGRLARRRGR